MKITSIDISNTPPVTKFHADNLSDVVVLAGGNGIGKTRLLQHVLSGLQGDLGNMAMTIEATCDEERQAWQKPLLSVSANIPNDVRMLQSTLLRGQRRKNLKGGVLYFESDRTVRQIKPLAWSWNFADPDEENVDPTMLFSGLQTRFQDTQHAIFKKIQTQKSQIAGQAIALRRQGKAEMKLNFGDPLDPFRDAFERLLGPKKLVEADLRRQILTFSDGNTTLDIRALSSGEREVVNIAFDVILRNPSDCVIFFDEPELHLHPELSYRLITTLRSIGERNQFIFCTHSPDIISSSLDDTVIFLTPANGDNNQAVQVRPDDKNREALSRLGHSVGIVSLGKKNCPH